MKHKITVDMLPYAVAPGQTIVDEIEAREMEYSEFARAMGDDAPTRDALLSGEFRITPEIANKLEAIVEIPAYIWLKFEQNFRRAVADGKTVLDARRTPEEDRVIRDREFAKDAHLPDYVPESAKDIPQKRQPHTSGKILLRVPGSLHTRLANIAKAEGISLNQLLLSYVAEGAGRSERL